MNEGDAVRACSGMRRLAGGRRGGDHRPRLPARRLTSARGCTSATSRPPARSSSIRWAKSKGWNVTAEVTPHHLLLTDDLVATLRPDLQGQPAAAHGRPTSRRCAPGWPTAPSTASPPTTPRTRTEDKECEWAAAAFGMLGLETALSVVQQTMVDTGLLDWAGVADRMSARPARDRPGRPTTAARSRSGRRPTSCWSTRPPRRVDRRRPSRRRCRATRRTPGWSCPAGSSPRSCAARPTVLDGKLQ